jgi:HK97 gp10 family phage protein
MQSAATADLSALAAQMAKAGTSIQQEAEHIIKDAATQIQSVAQSLAPVKTGALRQSITITYLTSTKAVIGPHVIYGAYQEFGTGSRGEFPTGPYEIKPKNKQFLVFKTKDGRWIRTKHVIHPGVKAQPYMRPAVKQVIDNMAPELAKQGALKIVGK